MDQHSKVMYTLTWVVAEASMCGNDHGYAFNLKAHQDVESTMAIHVQLEGASRCGVDHGYAFNLKANQDVESTMAMHSI